MKPDILRMLRERMGITQSEAARRMGIVRTTYSNYEAGNREPDNETLKKIADFYGVSVDFLLGAEEKKKPNENDLVVKEVLEAYNRLSPEKKKIVEDLIKALMDTE